MQIPHAHKKARTAVVVDDDPATQQMMIRSLEQIDITARGFGDGESALAWLEANPAPDLIAVDLQLPRMSGFELSQRLRELAHLKTVPLIVTTARQHLQDEAAALELDAGFLAKPFRVREYLATLQQMLPPQTEPPVVLVIDDDPAIREALVGVIEDEGFATMSAGDGMEALKLLGSVKVKPALIVLDLMMPRMDGIELAHRMRADPALAGIPVLLFSANDHVASVAIEVGAFGHLKKPVDLEALMGMINGALGAAVPAKV